MNMDEYRWNYKVPAFGSWDYENEEMEYTKCFENATSYVRTYGTYNNSQVQDTDLYVAADLYQNDILTPAVILLPRRIERKGGNQNVKSRKIKEQNMQKQEWGGYSYDIKAPPSPIISPPKPHKTYKSKAIDQDLYQVPPEFFHVKPKKKRGFGIFASCLQPTCV